MRARHWSQLLVATAACAAVASPVVATAADARIEVQVRIGQDRGWRDGPRHEVYDRGYREGYVLGERQARRNRACDIERESVYRRGDRGYNRRFGSRDQYRLEFRRGFSHGYRVGYDRVRVQIVGPADARRPRGRVTYYEPAFGRGYEDGYEQGLRDGRGRDRYDPVGDRDYRAGDHGYSRSYGSRDAYKRNYRAGFRQGYEEAYRAASR